MDKIITSPKTRAKTPMALVKAIGKESIAILAGAENRGFHCRSMVTQMPINGQSRAEILMQKSAGISAVNLIEYEMFVTSGNAADHIANQYKINDQEPRCGNTVS